jgi:hypothetical protein
MLKNNYYYLKTSTLLLILLCFFSEHVVAIATGSNGKNKYAHVFDIKSSATVGSVGNYVWDDADGDGVQDAGESGINGVEVQLWDAGIGGTVGGGDDALVETAITATNAGASGYYNFTVAASGNYFVKFPPTNGSQRLTVQTSVPGTDGNSDPNLISGNSDVFAIDVNGTGVAKDNTTIDAGFTTPTISIIASASGCYDDNGNAAGGNSKALVQVIVSWLNPPLFEDINVTVSGSSMQTLSLGGGPSPQIMYFEVNAGSSGTVNANFTTSNYPATQQTYNTGSATSCILTPCIDNGGIVFRDFNNNGIKDTYETEGVAGITVTAYWDTGASSGMATTTTDGEGQYNIATGTGSNQIPSGAKVRMEFSSLPTGVVATANGSNNRTSVQFFTAPSCSIDLGVNYPTDYCQETPNLVVPKMHSGDPLLGGDAATEKTLVTFPYDYTTTSPAPSVFYAEGSQTGSIWGTAYHKKKKKLFSSAIARRHVGFGPLGPGGIYVTDLTTGTTSNFVNLSTIGVNVGTDQHSGLMPNYADPSKDSLSFHFAGKMALGGMDLSDDERYLFVMNLQEKELIRLDIGVNAEVPTASDVTKYSLSSFTCANGNLRPWGVKYHRGKVYVGVVCDASESGSRDDLRAKVLVLDLVTSTFSLVTEYSLNYIKGAAGAGQGIYWNAWTEDPSLVFVNNRAIYPQPILSSITFDTDNTMVMGFLDRAGLQSGKNNYNTNGVGSYEGMSGGDILRAYYFGGMYQLEDNAKEGYSSPKPATIGNGNVQGPNYGEFYWDDRISFDGSGNGMGIHAEVSLGSVEMKLGNDEVVNVVYDPVYLSEGGGYSTNGIHWYSNTTGGRTHSYTIADVMNAAATFGKAGGLGDVELICDQQPLEIGNYVWADLDNNGIQDPTETGLANIKVQLLDRNGNLIGVTTTNAQGEYYFNTANVDTTGVNPTGTTPTTAWSGLSYNTQYYIVLGNGGTNPFASGVLTIGSNYYSLSNANTGEGSNTDINDNDAIVASGFTGTLGTNLNGFPYISVVSGNAGEASHTYDFSFKTAPPPCSVTVDSATPTACAPTTNTYSLDVAVTYTNQPTGDITINVGGTDYTFTPDGTSPDTYTVTGLTSNGAADIDVSATFVGDNTCTHTLVDAYDAPASCACNLSATTAGNETNVSCNGGSDGAVGVTATGNLVPVTYLWSNGETTASITGLTAGTYTVTVTETPSCTAVASYTVTEPTLLDAACSKTDATTIGGNQGTANVVATGGTAPYTYLWSNGETTASITGLTAGTYNVTVTDLNGCTANCSVTVQEPSCNLSASTTGNETNVSCNGGSDGAVGVTATGNLVPVTYLWSNGETTASITGLTAGTYTVTVTETPSCTAVASYTVTEPTLLDAACSKTDATTIGGNQGTANVVATGGTAPYTYLWSNGETTASISGLTAGTYTVTVTDLNGCTANCSVTVQEPGCNLSASTTGNETNVSCNGGSDGAVGVTATGNLVPVTYLWSNGETTASITGLTAGTYTVTVTETPTCTAVASYTVTEPAILDAACSKTDATTIGGNQGTASVVATGGTSPYTYLWSNGETTASISGLTTGTYTVTVTDLNGCTANCSVTVQEPGCNLSASTTGNETNVSCNGGSDGAVGVTATGNLVPVTYLWSNGETTASITGLTAGTYTVTVTETPSCTAVASYTVTEPTLLDAACSKTDATTIGGNQGTANVVATGGTSPYTYLWSNGETTASISGLTTGTYTVTVTDLNGCTANCSVTVQEPGCNLSASTTGNETNVSCNGGSDGAVGVTATGNLVPVTYLWSNGETTASITGLTAGTYTVTVTETPSCTAVASYTVTEPTLLDAACSKTDATTIGGNQGTASVVATGGTSPYTYLWSNGETTASISGLTTGTYTVTVTDLNGCTANCSVTVQEPGCNLSASTTGNETNVSCNGGSDGAVGVTATGNLVPVTYLWSNGETTASITGLTAGTYTVTVTETPSCTAVASYTVTEPTLLDAACSKTDATTIGGNQGTANVVATGGTSPYTYLWSNGETTASISGLTTGTYTVTVTDLNGCTANCSVTVQEPGCNLSASTTGNETNVSCNGGSDGAVGVTATGNLVPVTYLWSNGETTASITGLTAGTYTVTVTETPSCTAVASYTVTEPTLLDAACSKTDATTIGGNQGTANVVATGGTSPYTYLWSNGETTASISGLTTGTYTVTVTDLNGCTANCSVTVQEPGCNLSASTTGNETNVSCNGGSDGAVGVTATGNLVPVTYLWSNGETTASITGLTAGTYTVTVTETPSCTAVASYTVTEPTLLDAACSKTDVTTNGGADGTATVSATGGISPYTYLWNSGETTASISNKTAATYTVTVTDANGCTDVCASSINEPGALCNLTGAGLAAVMCNDNGTSADATDDYIGFTLNPTGTTLGSGYVVTVSSGSITPSTGTYGAASNFQLQNGSAGSGATITVTITDNLDSNCKIQVDVVDTGSCSTPTCPPMKCLPIVVTKTP